jgi:DNA-binding winged helix-turn-helix (wHTH) protein
MNFHFGEFVLDRRTGLLTGPDGELPLRRQTYRLLEVLLENAPELVNRDRLLDEAWGRTALSPNVLPQAISELRQVLGDNSQAPRYIETMHRRGYRIICPVELIGPEPEAGTFSGWFGRRLVQAAALGLVLAAGLFATLWLTTGTDETAAESIAPTAERAVVALGVFPHQNSVPDWIPAAALELMTRLLASDERVLVLRGESLGLDTQASGARWQHAVQDLLNAPLAITGYWRIQDADQLRLDLNLIELSSGQLVHGGQFVAAINDLDVLIAHASDEMRTALNLPHNPLPMGWQNLPAEQRRSYWQGLASLNMGHHAHAARSLQSLHEELGQPAWLAPQLARALRLNGQTEEAGKVLTAALDAPDTLSALGTSLRLRAELARLQHDRIGTASALRALSALFPDEVEILIELANAEFDSLEGSAARATMQRLEAHPQGQDDPRKKLLDARLARLEGRLDVAGQMARSALSDAEEHNLPHLAAPALLALVETLVAQGQLPAALEAIEDQLASWSNRLESRQAFELNLRMVQLKRMMGQFDQALDLIEQLEDADHNGTRGLPLAVERAVIQTDQALLQQALATLADIEPDLNGELEPELRIAYHNARARILTGKQRIAEARAEFDLALELARNSGQAHHMAGTLVNAGMTLAGQRRLDEADRLWERARDIFEDIGDRRGLALCLSNLAATSAIRGLEQRSLELNDQALVLFREMDMSSQIARTSYNLALLASRYGRLDEAEQLFLEAYSNYQVGGNHSIALAAGSRQADTLVALGRLDDSFQLLLELEPLLELSSPLHQADWYSSMARTHKWAGNGDQAREALRRAHELQTAANARGWQFSSEIQLEHLELLTGADPVVTQLNAERLVRNAKELNEPRLQAWALALVAESLLMQSRAEEARIILRDAYVALDEKPDVLIEMHLDWLNAWTFDLDGRRPRLEVLAERMAGYGMTSHLSLVRYSLNDQTQGDDAAAETPSGLLPAYARNPN